MTLYETLGITPEEKRLQGKEFEDVVKRQYRKCATQWHPDKFQDQKEKDNATDKFKKIAEAKEVLSDSQKRMQYDMTGSTSGFNYNNFNTYSDLEDILQNAFNGGGFGFRGGSFRTNQQQERRYKGEDATIRITLDIKDLFTDVKKTYKYKRKVACPQCDGAHFQVCTTCQGSGMVTTTSQMGSMLFQQSKPCPRCNGVGQIKQNTQNCHHCNNSGLIEKEEIITMNLPKGITKDVVITNNGMGHELPKGYTGVPGDLKIIVGKINCESYIIDSYNLIRNLDVPILDIITGTTIEITDAIGGKLKVDIPKNHPEKNPIRFNGRGLPTTTRHKSGDLFIIVNYKFPDILDKSEKKKIDELKSCKNFK